MPEAGENACMFRPSARHHLRRVVLSLAFTVALLVVAATVALGHNNRPPVPAFPSVLLAWTLDPVPIVGVGMAAAAYLWAERRVARRHPASPAPRHRRWLFM